jgi:hypothetical protein
MVVFICGIFVLACWAGSQPGSTRTAGIGIRIPATKASDEAWVAGHAAALPHAKRCAFVLVPLSLITVVFIFLAPLVAMVAESVLAAASLAWLFVATAAASKAAKAVTAASVER